MTYFNNTKFVNDIKAKTLLNLPIPQINNFQFAIVDMKQYLKELKHDAALLEQMEHESRPIKEDFILSYNPNTSFNPAVILRSFPAKIARYYFIIHDQIINEQANHWRMLSINHLNLDRELLHLENPADYVGQIPKQQIYPKAIIDYFKLINAMAGVAVSGINDNQELYNFYADQATPDPVKGTTKAIVKY